MKDKQIRKILIEYLKANNPRIRIFQEKSIGSSICDVNGTHGLGDIFIKRFIQKYFLILTGIYDSESVKDQHIFKLILSDASSFEVYREHKNIDILLLSKSENMLLLLKIRFSHLSIPIS